MALRDWFFKDRSFHVKVVKDGEAGEEIVSPAEMAKTHWDKYKKAYLIGGGVVTVTGVTGYLVGSGKAAELAEVAVPQIINNVAPVITPVFNNTVNFGGHMTKLVKCLETGEMWETVTEAAKATGSSLSMMSRHLNGHMSDLYGNHYEIIGIGTSA